jgi:fermentation-respiration switch protein FrsA (DUF1100 family)
MVAGTAVLVLVLLFGGLVLYSPRYFYRMVIKRKQPFGKPGRWTDSDPWVNTQAFERVSIVSRDGLKLNAYYVAAPAKSGDTAIFAHGYMGDGKAGSCFARIFYEKLNCNVLLPDARGYGYSEGAYTGFGWHERLDVLQWMEWIKARSPDVPARIALFGVSMGAATMLMVSGENPPPELKLVIEDCSFTNMDDEMRHQLFNRFRLPRAAGERILRIASALTKKRAGYSFEEASALNQVKKSKIPTLFIHGDADNYVPTEMVHILYDACTAEKELYIVKGAAHVQAYKTDPEEYEKRMIEFVMRHMP